MSGKASSTATSQLIDRIIRDTANSDSIFTSIPLDTLLAGQNPEAFTTPDSYINKPGSFGANWQYGYPAQFSLERMHAQADANEELREINRKANRI